jgi:hypothetical protein
MISLMMLIPSIFNLQLFFRCMAILAFGLTATGCGGDSKGGRTASSQQASSSSFRIMSRSSSSVNIIVLADPVSMASVVGGSAVFRVLLTESASQQQWERSNNNGVTWEDIPNAHSVELILNDLKLADNGLLIRARVRPQYFSRAAKLTVLNANHLYYVSPQGSNSDSGESLYPWRTITYAVSNASAAKAGDAIFVRSGLYKGESIVFEKDNLSVIGYKYYPGDSPMILANSADPFLPFDQNEQPLIDGENRALGIGINLRERTAITLKNISLINYAYGVIAGNSSQSFQENHVLDNVNVSTIGDVNNSYSGVAMGFGTLGTKFSNNNKITNSLIVNAAAEGLTFAGNNNVADNVKVYCNDTTNDKAATDYYVTVFGNNNTVKNSLVSRKAGLYHSGHGFSVKTNAQQIVDDGANLPVINSEYNSFITNTAINVGEGFVVRHRGARFNVFKDNIAYGTHAGSGDSGEGSGIVIRDGASDNNFINTKMENTDAAIVFIDSVEDGDTGANPPGHPGNNNVIDGAQVKNSYIGVSFSSYSVPSDAGANTIKNSSFFLTRYMHRMARHATKMSYINNIYSGTNAVVPKPGGYFSGYTYKSDIIPSQFSNCTYQDIEGGMPSGF